MLVLPYVSLVEAKLRDFEEFAEPCNVVSEGYFGSHGTFPVPLSEGIIVATIEKANSIFHTLVEEGRLDELYAFCCIHLSHRSAAPMTIPADFTADAREPQNTREQSGSISIHNAAIPAASPFAPSTRHCVVWYESCSVTVQGVRRLSLEPPMMGRR